MLFILRRTGEEAAKLLILQFPYCLVKDLLVCLIAYIGYEAALFSSEKVAGTADVKVLQGNIEPASKLLVFLNGPESPAGVTRQHREWRSEKVTKSLPV